MTISSLGINCPKTISGGNETLSTKWSLPSNNPAEVKVHGFPAASVEVTTSPSSSLNVSPSGFEIINWPDLLTITVTPSFLSGIPSPV